MSNEEPMNLDLTAIEKHVIKVALERAKGDRDDAADLLGISRASLYRKIKIYRLASIRKYQKKCLHCGRSPEVKS